MVDSRHRHGRQDRPDAVLWIVDLGRGGRCPARPALDPASGRQDASIVEQRQRLVGPGEIEAPGRHPRSVVGVVALRGVERLRVARSAGNQHRTVGQGDRHRVRPWLEHVGHGTPVAGRGIEDRGGGHRVRAGQPRRSPDHEHTAVMQQGARGRPSRPGQRVGLRPRAVPVDELRRWADRRGRLPSRRGPRLGAAPGAGRGIGHGRRARRCFGSGGGRERARMGLVEPQIGRRARGEDEQQRERVDEQDARDAGPGSSLSPVAGSNRRGARGWMGRGPDDRRRRGRQGRRRCRGRGPDRGRQVRDRLGNVGLALELVAVVAAHAGAVIRDRARR